MTDDREFFLGEINFALFRNKQYIAGIKPDAVILPMNSTIRKYEAADHQACLEIFDSNTPPYFDEAERPLFATWLNAHDKDHLAYNTSEKEEYFVLVQNNEVKACAGYYCLKNESEARMAWGMVNKDQHKLGFGTGLLHYRIEHIRKHFPEYKITLGTSQHTFAFFERYSFQVIQILPNGYGKGIDRYDMELIKPML